MRCERFELRGEPAGIVAQLRGLIPAPASVAGAVAEIIDAVRHGGEQAVLDYTRRFDMHGAEPRALRVQDEELDAEVERLDDELRHALELAIAHVEKTGWAMRGPAAMTLDLGGHAVGWRKVPVNRAAVYVPSGRAPYPSTVVMGVVPARVAGVKRIAVCAPPGPGGEVSAVIMAACRLAGASVLYRMGGAHAIAALALGVESVEPVDVIVGPGNLYVQEAKRQLFGAVGIDGFAGPSDLIVIADAATDPEPVALDLLAQAEHGPGTLVIAVSNSTELLDALAAQVSAAPES